MIRSTSDGAGITLRWDLQWKKDVIFLLTLVSCAFAYQYERHLALEPSGPHTWRQADCTSIIDNYYSHGMRFFWPEIHYRLSDGDTSGYTAGEFPGLYYFNAWLWTLFGKHIWIPRVVSLLITFLGLFALFRAHLLWTKSFFWSLVSTLLIFATPVIAEYGMNFLTDVPAFGFALMGWYFFTRFYFERGMRFLWTACFFFMLAGLLKVSALILFVCIGAVFVLDVLGLKMGPKRSKLFDRPIKQGLALAATVAGVVAWYAYANYFNNEHGGRYTFNNVWPIWKLNADQIGSIASAFWEWAGVFVLPKYFWFAVPILVIGWAFIIKGTSRFIATVSGLTLVGVLMYFGFWYQAIDQHDYYFANGFALAVVLPLPYLTSKIDLLPFFKTCTKLIAIGFLGYGVLYTKQNLELRHFPVQNERYSLMYLGTVDLMKWYHWERTSRVRALGDLQPLLDSLGVTRQKRVIVAPDPTFNHTLYLIDRKGWTSFGDRPYRKLVDDCMEKGAEFLIVIHPDVFLTPGMENIRQFRVGQLQNAEVIDLKAFKQAGYP